MKKNRQPAGSNTRDGRAISRRDFLANAAVVGAGAAIPLAAGVLARWGIVLPPAVGAVLMSFSTVIVAVNAQVLRRARL